MGRVLDALLARSAARAARALADRASGAAIKTNDDIINSVLDGVMQDGLKLVDMSTKDAVDGIHKSKLVINDLMRDNAAEKRRRS